MAPKYFFSAKCFECHHITRQRSAIVIYVLHLTYGRVLSC